MISTFGPDIESWRSQLSFNMQVAQHVFLWEGVKYLLGLWTVSFVLQHCYPPAATASDCCFVTRGSPTGSISMRQLGDEERITTSRATLCFVTFDRQPRRRLTRYLRLWGLPEVLTIHVSNTNVGSESI